MDKYCQCQDFPLGSTKTDEQTQIPCKTAKKIIIDFGKVAVCGKYVKTCTLKNLNNDDVLSYRIKRDDGVDPLYRVFNIKNHEGFINPGESLKLKIEYKPVKLFEIDIDTFEFVDSACNIIKIRTVGESLGPRLVTSVKRLDFYVSPIDKITKRTFEVRNLSIVPAQFIFDCNKEQGIFQVVPEKGTLQGDRHIYVEVYFVPKEPGSFSQQLNCLTWCDSPFGVELFGLCTENDCPYPTGTCFESYPFPFEETIGYGAYLQDTVGKKNILPLSLSRSNIDFGRGLKGSKSPNYQVTSMTNYMTNAINVMWPKDDVFKIIPNCITIPPNNSTLFECYFTPSDNNALYYKMLIAQIHWISHHKFAKGKDRPHYIPITATLRVQGHSFPEGQYWIGNIEIIPSIITLPPCLPGNTSNTNFKIQATGHLPVMFKLVPPKKTNIVMKPMAGIIYSYAIIVVQLFTEKLKNTTVYTEEWYVELNGREEKQIPFCVRGETSIPKVTIGHDDSIKFESVQPDCETVLAVPIRNQSSFQIRYMFNSTECEFLQINPTKGNLFANDEVYIQCCYTGNMCAPMESYVKYQLQAIQRLEQLIGKPYLQTLTVHTKCALSQLCAIPNYHDFKEVQWGTNLKTNFHLFNFGESTVNFKFSVSSRYGEKNYFKLDPQYGVMKPREKMKIRISGPAKHVGTHIFSISYAERTSSSSKQVIENSIINVFEMEYNCSYPTIQIEEIVEHSFGPLFGKRHFWRYLQIDRFNSSLRSITNGETYYIYAYLPEFAVGNDMYYITLLVKNISQLNMTVDLKRKKLCDCPLVEEPGHVNIRKKVYDCIHREMLIMELQDTVFHQGTEQFLIIRVKYLLPGKTVMTYVLHLGDDRKIEIAFSIFSIPDDVLRISCYKSEYIMQLADIPVYRRVAPVQTFWLYNNTKEPVPYKVDTRELLWLCQQDSFEVMKCINPEGVIEPYSSTALLIKFHPIEMKIYEVTVPLILGHSVYNFSITGTGKAKELSKPYLLSRMPALSKRIYKFPVNLSSDVIIFDALPVWSTSEKVVFLRNISKDKIIEYSWGKCGINDVVEVTTNSKSGVLKPKEFHAILIRTKSFNEACITSLTLFCEMIDHVQLFLHKKSLEFYNKRQEEVEAEFTITEKGISYQTNEVPVVDKPEPFTISLSIHVNIIHTKDKDVCLNLEEQFYSSPQDDLSINIEKILEECIHCSKGRTDNDSKIMNKIDMDKTKISNILEELLADYIFSDSFMEMFKTSHNQEPPIYSQFILDDSVIEEQITEEPFNEVARENEIKRLFTQPKLTVVSETIKELILDSIHEIFKLGGKQTYSQQDIDREIENLVRLCSINDCDNNC